MCGGGGGVVKEYRGGEKDEVCVLWVTQLVWISGFFYQLDIHRQTDAFAFTPFCFPLELKEKHYVLKTIKSYFLKHPQTKLDLNPDAFCLLLSLFS